MNNTNKRNIQKKRKRSRAGRKAGGAYLAGGPEAGGACNASYCSSAPFDGASEPYDCFAQPMGSPPDPSTCSNGYMPVDVASYCDLDMTGPWMHASRCPLIRVAGQAGRVQGQRAQGHRGG